MYGLVNKFRIYKINVLRLSGIHKAPAAVEGTPSKFAACIRLLQHVYLFLTILFKDITFSYWNDLTNHIALLWIEYLFKLKKQSIPASQKNASFIRAHM
jgi:hypothetical protein